jgi:hypothetical protein
VEALNRYAAKLQNSLKIINTNDGMRKDIWPEDLIMEEEDDM